MYHAPKHVLMIINKFQIPCQYIFFALDSVVKRISTTSEMGCLTFYMVSHINFEGHMLLLSLKHVHLISKFFDGKIYW